MPEPETAPTISVAVMELPAQPLGSGDYVVRVGDCIGSIAFEHGHFPDTIWNDPGNAVIKSERKDPNTLVPGDKLVVPPIRVKTVGKPPEARHRFRRKGVPARLNLVLKHQNEPLRNEPYVLDIDGKITRGKTTAKGELSIFIPPNAQAGRLLLRSGPRQIEYQLDLGTLAPIDTVIGFKQRLRNLGYDVGELDARLTPDFERAIQTFEAEQGLPSTGAMGSGNTGKLKEVYGC